MNTDQGSLLLVDDDDITRDLLARHLEGKGYAVTGMTDGTEALARIEKGGVDLLLLDILLDGLSGLDMLQVVRQKYSAADLPIIMATSMVQSQDVVEALKLGANDYVTKPFDVPVVLARVQTQLSLKRAVDQIRRLEQRLSERNAELETANQRMQRDLEAAARVQMALLPSEPVSLPGVCFAWQFRPCTELAGDLLNIVPLDDRHVALNIFDVVGHGAAAALLAVMVNRVLAQLLSGRPHWTQPVGVGLHLNREFPCDPRTDQFFTLQHGVLDLVTGEFRYISTGHPGPVYLPRNGPAQNRCQPGLPIGLGEGLYEEQVLTLAPGDRLFLYSDGLPDALNADKQHFGEVRLLTAIEQGRYLPLSESLERLLHSVEHWCGTGTPHDDISILAVERTPAG